MWAVYFICVFCLCSFSLHFAQVIYLAWKMHKKRDMSTQPGQMLDSPGVQNAFKFIAKFCKALSDYHTRQSKRVTRPLLFLDVPINIETVLQWLTHGQYLRNCTDLLIHCVCWFEERICSCHCTHQMKFSQSEILVRTAFWQPTQYHLNSFKAACNIQLVFSAVKGFWSWVFPFVSTLRFVFQNACQ